MTDPTHRIPTRLRLVFAPGTGRRRADARPAAPAPAAKPRTPRPSRRQVAWCGPGWGWTARPWSPYGHRQERARQRRRCLTLVTAAHFGIDLDRRVLHGAGAGR
ncbi:hypothetical protein I3F58_17180 [Streptomyces sp. MUM 203J]|uniref:hypothetical protein n=1 Tax=Streptomyces sp. MUM 203J TaxID=2791990 RepID=UPI001F0400DD|nr:hypothetical protein [Streptomyces sp. MUM 203J]MCH0541268.1 hypothetical protein [Streptomyces sp. MUM 203J]